MLDPQWYEGREQALVKHTFLDTYMPAQIPKIVSWANEFTYIDLFAGPWQSKSGDYADTSFGIALGRMTEAKAMQARLGRTVKMVAHLVEKDAKNFAELTEAVKRFSDVEVHCYQGVAELHAATIASLIPTRAFRFVVIDPKGVPDVRKFKCLIEPGNTEVLLNFMFQFANRFAGSQDRMPTLEGWLGGLSEEEGSWRRDFAELKGQEREAAITDRARQALRNMGGYVYAPALTVDETATERPLYKLIYLSRHPVGLRVFRDAHVKALEAQATYKSAKKAESRRQKSGMDDLFASPTAINPGERSALEITGGAVAAQAMMMQMLADKHGGIDWKDIWPRVLDACVITHNELGDCVRDLRSNARVNVPAWTSAAVKRPKDEFTVSLP
ncbi:three-Cys-motif partner protein TcmP [Sphingomonas glacialis]|uniref:Three-Cys-motif partner protein TcmP n=1 Tax=Sphingomonas glacialis TaxID=658225 RepID=A0A502G3P1_9SPHN|nr:three-Cys-motif partner protein TcmP [Sphingomonas glacialis]TPG56587.1 three-Cys-motif partner protein TcmP [Sphingomonas glacialis]